jgi:hypothetical protein
VIDAPTSHDNAEDKTVDRYCFLVKVTDDINQLTEYYFVAKVEENIRGHTNADKRQPIKGRWKVIGKFTEGSGNTNPFDIPPSGVRGWANQKGELYSHDCLFTTNTYNIEVKCEGTNYQQFNWYYPKLTHGCSGQYSAATHHTTVAQFNSSYNMTTQNHFVQTVYGKPLSPKINAGEQELFSRLVALLIKEYGDSLNVYNIQRFSFNEKQAVVFSAVVSDEFGDFLYVDGAKNFVLLGWKGNDINVDTSLRVDAGIISVNTSGTMITFPTYPPLDTSRAFIKQYYDEGSSCYYNEGYGDIEMTSFYRAKALAWLVNSGKFSGYSNTPVIINASISVSEDGTLTVSHHDSTSIECRVESDASHGTAADYWEDAEATLEFSGSLFAYRGDSLVSEYVNSTYTTTHKSRNVNVKYESAGPALYPIRYDTINSSLSVCKGGEEIAFSGDLPVKRTLMGRGQYHDPGSFSGGAYTYSQSINVKFNDAWSSYDLTTNMFQGRGSVDGNPCAVGVGITAIFKDKFENVVTYIGMTTAPEYGIVDPEPTYLTTYPIVSIAAPEVEVLVGYASSKMAAYKQAVYEASHALGSELPVSYYECETISSTKNVSMYTMCGTDTYGDIINVNCELTLKEMPPLPPQEKKKLKLRDGFNLVTNSTELLHDYWVTDGVYGLDSAVGIFDPMLGVVERMFSGYTGELQERGDNIRLHLLEVKYHASATPVSIVKAETLPPHHWSESSALDHYPRSTYCVYVHENSARSTVCISYGKTFTAGIIPTSGIEDYQSACIVDGDNGDVIDILALCGIPNTKMIYSLPSDPHECVGRFYDVSICVIPKELIKEDWPRP